MGNGLKPLGILGTQKLPEGNEMVQTLATKVTESFNNSKYVLVVVFNSNLPGIARQYARFLRESKHRRVKIVPTQGLLAIYQFMPEKKEEIEDD